MDRRDLLVSLGAAAVTAAAIPTFAQHEHHNAGAKNQALIDAASNCSGKAEICSAHCLEHLAQGDKAMAACAASAREAAVA